MVLLTNNAEGGTSGTAVTTGNSGGTSGGAWDTINVSAPSTFTFDNAHAAHGTLSYNCSTGGSLANSAVAWAASLTGTSLTQVWFRAYLYLTANPGSTVRVVRAVTSGTFHAGVGVNSTGKIVLIDGGGTTRNTSTTTVPLNTWFRIEGFFVGSATVGQIEAKLFTSSMDEVSPDETVTSLATLNTVGTVNQLFFGDPAALINYTFWLDDLGASDTAYIGPAGVPGAATLSGSGTLSAGGTVTTTNNAEGGTSGTTVSTGNSGGTSGTAFDVVTIGTSSAVTFDNGHAAHGSLAYKMAVPVGVANISSVAWTTSLGTQTTVWFRLYLYFTSQPATFGVWRALQAANLCAGVVLVSDGTMQVRNAANGTVFTTASVIPLNQWFRLEGFVIGSATVGQVELKFFSSLDATVPDETQTSLANLNLRGPPNTYQAGALTSVGSTFWMDDLGLSTGGYLGPAGSSGASTMSGLGTLAAGPQLAAMATMSGMGTLAGMGTVVVPVISVPGESVSSVAALAGSSSSVTSAGSSVSTVTTLN